MAVNATTSVGEVTRIISASALSALVAVCHVQLQRGGIKLRSRKMLDDFKINLLHHMIVSYCLLLSPDPDYQVSTIEFLL